MKSLRLIDIIVTKKQAYKCSSSMLVLGNPGHLVQILNVKVNGSDRGPVKIRKKQFIKESAHEFDYLLQNNPGRRVFRIQISISVLIPLSARPFIIIIQYFN
jgi:hypothetical protein